MMKSTILCIGHPENPNIQALGKQVKALDKEARMVIFQPGLDGHFIEISGGNKTEFSCVLVVNGERIPGKSITSVLYYLKPIAQADNLKGLIAQEFIDSEWDEVISSLEFYLSHAQWVNPLNGSFLRDCKPYQQRLAQEVGLTVPRTTITNDVAAVEKALDEGRIIFKAMSPLFTSEGQVFVPTEMTNESLSLYRTGIAKCPAIFQQFVKKRSNLRVYVVGSSVSAVRIAAQAPKKQEDLKAIYSATQISESLKERILEFHKRAGLVYGAYDFLECDDGVFFMECQPLGSWICLERIAGLKTTELIAQYLLGRDETCLEFSASAAEK